MGGKLHTVQCSPSKSGFHTGTHTCHRGHFPLSAVPPVVLPLASYTGYSEKAGAPHMCGRRHGRLHRSHGQGRSLLHSLADSGLDEVSGDGYRLYSEQL